MTVASRSLFSSLSRSLGCMMTALSISPAISADVWQEVEHGFVDNDGVKIHYAAMGDGPLVVMIHGFPDFWYSWRHQMDGLKGNYRVVAIDQRGYNQSDKPTGNENYAMPRMVSDIAAVIAHFGVDKATVVGHDWGGMVAWNVAFRRPELVERLVIMNLPHPNGLNREMTINPDQRANSDYAQRFKAGSPTDPDIFFGGPMTPQTLSSWVTDPEVRVRYQEAFEHSDFDAMLAYYKQNYPDLPEFSEQAPPPNPHIPRLTMPVLVFHGLADTALDARGLNNTWEWIDAETTIVTIPGAGHFVQQDEAEKVTNTLTWWLSAH
ncbi:alpha/beta hydrolase [Pseudohongiella nitratireducens]|uniref:alpha/beta fold hydrolase n=1 Tax=Pseudohongiella nitratireducens TaxID=1768907 RepID=UPI0030EB9422